MIHALVPAGFAERPSGGNVYDRRLLAGLAAAEVEVVAHEVEPHRPLPALPPGAVALVDSQVSSWHAPALQGSGLRLVPVVHMLFGADGERELLAAAPAVVTTSGWTRRRLVDRYAVDPARVHVAAPGVTVGSPAPGTATAGELLCVGPVVPAKGQDVLLAALTALTDLEWRCTVVGPLDADPDFVDALHKTAADAGIGDRVRFTGPLPHARVLTAYDRADLLVHPSRAETYGMVVTEALAHALPVVAAEVGGVPEALGRADDGSTPGVLVRPSDPVALSAALRRWLTDPMRRRRLRRSAALRRLTLRTWSQTTAEVLTALEAVS